MKERQTNAAPPLERQPEHHRPAMLFAAAILTSLLFLYLLIALLMPELFP